MTNRRVIALAGLALVACIAPAQSRKYLNIGDPAPSIASAKWLKGTPVPAFKKGEVYVVEFWATWCTPCKALIPHLTELAAKYKGSASIVGISVQETNDPTSTTFMGKVEAFVKEQKDRMNYHVAADRADGKVNKSWLTAADEPGLPTTFIVGRDGKIAWIGHAPQLDGVLAEIVANKFDITVARARRAVEVETTRPIREALEAREFPKAVTLMDAAIAKRPEQERIYTYDRLVALFHCDVKRAMTDSDKIIQESNGDIGAYRMIVSIFASQKDLSPEVYTYGKSMVEDALAKGEMKYLFLSMRSEIRSSLGMHAEAVQSQEEAVTAAEGDPHAPAEFLKFLRKKLDEFRAKAKG